MTEAGHKKKPVPHFEVCLRGVYPEDVSIRAVAEAIAALQNIVESGLEPQTVVLSLLDIVRGSAVYRCVSSHPREAMECFRLVGELVDNPGEGSGVLAQAFPHLRVLSEVARTGGGQVIIRRSGGAKHVLASIEPDTYGRLKSLHTVSGQTVLLGELKRVGGATSPRCMVRRVGQRKAVYCAIDVKQARTLARRLYQRVVLEGEAVWLRGTWEIVDFSVSRVVPYRRRSFADARAALRELGADRWDSIPDSELFFTSDDGGDA